MKSRDAILYVILFGNAVAGSVVAGLTAAKKESES